MWTCPKCKEQIEDNFDSCWKCAGTIQEAAQQPKKAKKPLEQFELICVLVAAMPGILLFTGGHVQNSAQAAFRIGVFLIGLSGFVGIKIYQHTKIAGHKRNRLFVVLTSVLILACTLSTFICYQVGYIRFFQHVEYSEHMDLAGKDLISLAGAPKAKAKALIPMLRDTTAMNKRMGLITTWRASNGEIADEVHDFLNAHQGTYRLKRLLLRDGRVIEVCFQW